ncbi:MAG: enoyl-CoA hydratase/isomerase family protein, partial [Rhodobacteraceae bacterium]|nr:enoyl-CoA hydratase/isomerase family protein [Paracoccaceae bacterium]
MNNFKYEVADHVAIITWDVPEKSHNIMSWKGFEELSELVDQALNDDAVRGIVITSGKVTFSLGMDLKILQELGNFANDPNKIYQSILSIHEKFRRIERAGGDHK